ncbi:MAG: hypothetical protein MUC65_09055 [Pontiellaceae bacterium]|jgi:hypothetical protein|nr:hypothetical protein [Pontiellaceae bacterium]
MSIGIGGAGSKLASLLGPEKATIVNVSQSELDKTEARNKILAVAHSSRGKFQGAGKNPEVGRTAFVSISEAIYELIKGEIVFTSTGGGTGNGIVSVLLNKIAGEPSISLNDKTLFAFILPYVELESAEFVENTVAFLMGPVSQAIDSGNTGNMILFSNKLKFEGRIAEYDYNTMLASGLNNFLSIPRKGDEMELLDGHVDHEDFRVYLSKPYFNHFCQFEYTPNRPFADLLKESCNQTLLPPEQPIEAMFLLEVPDRDMTSCFYNILDYFAADHVKPAYGVVLNPTLKKPVLTLSLLYSRKPKELVDDFCNMVERMTQKRLKKTINQFIQLEEHHINVEEAVRKIESEDESSRSVLEVLGRLKKLR